MQNEKNNYTFVETAFTLIAKEFTMSEPQWNLKEGAELNIEDVAKIACALKSLSAYTTLACAEDESPEDLEEIVNEGLMAIEKLFDV